MHLKLSDKIFLFSKTPYEGVHHIPIIQIHYLDETIDISKYDAIIATSKEVFPALDRITSWKELPVICVSEATAKQAREQGAKLLDLADGNAKSLFKLIEQKYSELSLLYPHAKVIAKEMDISHLDIDEKVVYETKCSKVNKIELPKDAICIFTSPSAIECFQQQYDFLPTYQIVCIGETTKDALPEGVSCVVSEKPSVQSTLESATSLL